MTCRFEIENDPMDWMIVSNWKGEYIKSIWLCWIPSVVNGSEIQANSADDRKQTLTFQIVSLGVVPARTVTANQQSPPFYSHFKDFPKICALYFF